MEGWILSQTRVNVSTSNLSERQKNPHVYRLFVEWVILSSALL